MDWLFFFGAAFAAALVWKVISENNKQKSRNERADAFHSAVDKQLSGLMQSDDKASLPVLDAPQYDYRPVGRELLLAIQSGAKRMEFKGTGRYSHGSSSVSIRVMKGVSYRVGGGSSRSEKAWQVTATGRLLVTDKAIVFESPEKNERITWGQIARVVLMADGCDIAKRTGPPRTYAINNPNPKFAAIVELMLNRTG